MNTKQKLPTKEKPNGSSRERARRANGSSLGKGQPGETNRRAAAVLEVLAGVRSPSQAAAALGLSVNYYYLLERKALAGLLAACEPQPKGPPGPSCQQQLARLQQELQKCRQECLRQASLVRAAERALGISAVAPPSRRDQSKPQSQDGQKSRRRRRPAVRALRAAHALRKNSALEEPSDRVEKSPDGRVPSNPTCVATDKESGDAQRPQAAGSGTC